MSFGTVLRKNVTDGNIVKLRSIGTQLHRTERSNTCVYDTIINGMKCEFHSHSHYSRGLTLTAEGLNSPTEMVERAKRVGLGCIALTDHDQMTGNKEAVEAGRKLGIIVIPGEEVTTSGIDRKMRGHIVALGIEDFIKPGLTVEETIDRVHEQGGIVIAAHPFDISRRGICDKARLCDAIEAFNAINIERLVNWKTMRFAKRNRLIAVTGTDAHWTEMLGYSYTMCDAHDMDSILKAIKKGDVQMHCRYVPSDVMTCWAIKRFQRSYDNVEHYIKNNYFYPKRLVALEFLKAARYSPGNIDYLMKAMGRAGVAGATVYSAIKLLLDV